MKKRLCIFLVVVILFTLVPLDTLAAEVITGTVTSLSVVTLPDKVKYMPGEVLDLTGLTAEAVYLDGSTTLLSADELTVDAPDLLEPGNHSVTVSYSGQSASFEIHVHDPKVLEAVEPTYVATGLTEGLGCGDPDCGEILQEQEVLEVKPAPELETPEITLEVSAEGVVISWNCVEYAETYQIFRKQGEGEWTLLDAVAETSFTDSTAESGVRVSYSVRACLETADGPVSSEASNEESVFFVAVTLSNIANGVSIKWTALEDASYYRIYRRLAGDDWETICSKSTDDSFVDTTAESGVTYQYAVRARVGEKFTNYNYDLEFIRLSQPEAAASNRVGGIRISWSEVVGAESYNVYRKVSDGSWKRLDTVTGTTFLDKTAESGTTYTYTVRAKTGDTLSSNKYRVSILRLAQPEISLRNIAKGVRVEWTEVAGAETYRVYRKVDDGSWKLLKKDLTAQSYTDTTAEPGVTYYYSVRAYTDGTFSYHHLSETLIRLEQPKFTVSNYSNGMKLEWNETTGAESYNVYRKVSDGSWQLLANVTDTTYTDKSAEGGTTYDYTVRARNGSTLSSNNSRVSILRLAKTAVAVRNSYNGIFVDWSAVDGADTYRVYRKVPGGSWEQLKKGLTDLSYRDTTAEFGKKYLYAVRAYNTTGGSAYASSSEILRLDQPEAAVSNKSAGIQISWNEVENAESYNVYRRVSDGSWKRLANVADTTYLDQTAESGTSYTYTVRAKNGSVFSSNNNRASILRLSRPDATVSNAYTGVSVKWEAVEGAESYRVYRKVPDGNWKTVAADVAELKYTDTTAKSGVTYYYTVRAYGAGVLSGYQSTKAIQHLSRPVASAKTVSTTSVKITWGAVEGAAEYTLYVKNADSKWEKLYTGSGTKYTVNNLNFGKSYSFAVRALSDSSRSAQSAAVSGKATYPAPSYSLELKPGKGIKVSWDQVEGAGSYRVYRRTEDGSWKTLKTTTSTSFVDTTGRSGTTYEYAVRAFELADAEGVSGIRATGKRIVYSKIDPDKPMIALTFDDGPSKYTSDILDELEKYDARVTFFVVGERVSSYASTIKRAYSLGCEIGNHSWSHPSLSSLSVSAMKEEISKTDAAVEKIIGITPELLRPPYGAVDSDVKQYAGKPLIHWSVDTRDWDTQSSSSTINSVLSHARDGSIILMHDIYSATKNAAVSLIPTLINRGYQLVTVSEMAAYRGITLEDGTIYYSIYP